VTSRAFEHYLLCQTFLWAALFPGLDDVSCLTPQCYGRRLLMQSGRVLPGIPDPADRLVHICGLREWEQACSEGEVRPESLRDVGFVHLSTHRQVHLPANRLFAGRLDMAILLLDRCALVAPLRWEPGVPDDPASMLFPHLYGALPIAAVVAAQPYRPGPDGLFRPLLPPECAS